ncbi:MAG: DUF2007 domain-containing protein [Actinomycetota bacterium]
MAQTLAEAHLIRGYLSAEGIECEIRNEHLIGGMGELPVTAETLPQVWVDDIERQRARDLIHQALDQTRVQDTDWVCPQCQEPIQGQFTECWNCGAERPQF